MIGLTGFQFFVFSESLIKEIYKILIDNLCLQKLYRIFRISLPGRENLLAAVRQSEVCRFLSGHERSPDSLHSALSLLVKESLVSPGRLSVSWLLRDGSQGREDPPGLSLASELPAGRRVGVVASVLEAGDLPRPHQLVPGGGAVVGHHCAEPSGVGGEREASVP